MLDAVRDAMTDANHHHLDLNELNAASGARIAELLEVEAAMVTSGASGAIALAGGACVAGTDPELMQAIPDLSAAPRDEFIGKSVSISSCLHSTDLAAGTTVRANGLTAAVPVSQ